MKLPFRSGTAREILAISGAAAALITLHAQAPASDARSVPRSDWIALRR